MSNYKTFFTDCYNNVVFAIAMARDVRKYLREEKNNNGLWLELN